MTVPETANASSVAVPAKGISMSEVVKKFGEPRHKRPTVGGDTPKHPPITRWDYDGFVVIFEKDRVVDAVVPGAPPRLRTTAGLTPATNAPAMPAPEAPPPDMPPPPAEPEPVIPEAPKEEPAPPMEPTAEATPEAPAAEPAPPPAAEPAPAAQPPAQQMQPAPVESPVPADEYGEGPPTPK